MSMAFELSPILRRRARYSQDRSTKLTRHAHEERAGHRCAMVKERLLRTPVAISGDAVERTGFHVTDPDGIDVHETTTRP
jgi:hypothetical protein